MNEEIEFIKMLNLLMFASVAAIVATVNYWLLIRFVGGESVKKKIEEMEKNPLALAIWLGLGKFSVFFLYAYIFTRF